MIDPMEVKIIDINSEIYGVSADTLMENAGNRSASLIARYITDTMGKDLSKTKVLFVCGSGNNGGDGLVAARYMVPRCNVQVAIVGRNIGDLKTRLAKMNYAKFKEAGGGENITFVDGNLEELEKMITHADVVVDAMLGVGLRGRVREPISSIVELINTHSKGLGIPVISLDVPTGLGSEPSIRPTLTLTFHDIKTGMDQGKCGEITVVDIGVPKEAIVLVSKGELLLYPGIKNTHGHGQAHKGGRGRLMVVGGGAYVGAPILAARGALSVGTDLVYLCGPRAITLTAVQCQNDIIPIPVDVEVGKGNFGILGAEHVDFVLSAMDKYRVNAVCLGNGIGRSESTYSFVTRFFERYVSDLEGMPYIVVDADAITILAEAIKNGRRYRFGGKGVITPHLGEYNRLAEAMGNGWEISPEDIAGVDREAMSVVSGGGERKAEGDEMGDEAGVGRCISKVMAMARQMEATILLKSRFDVITDGKNLKINTTGNIGMSVGGTGDVLSGVVGGLLSMELKPFNAARLGAYINGYGGDMAWNHHRFGLTATDLISYIPRVFFEVDQILNFQK